jgi:DHA1 family inner membrane transport protein
MSPRLGPARVSAILFVCMFAAQAGLIALAPVLALAASDLGVSTATAGQLRTMSGLAAGITALALVRVGARTSLRRQLVLGAALLAVASLASAAAPSFSMLAAAQLLVGVAIAILVTAGTAAAADWVPEEQRARVLSWALIGNPAAWIVGMPTIGLVGEVSWRYGWLALTLPAAIAAAYAATRGPECRAEEAVRVGVLAVLADRHLAPWALGELLANSAWIGLLVYAGALFADSYGTSTMAIGVVLASAAAAFVAGNLAFRRRAEGDLRQPLIGLALAMGAIVPLVGTIRPGPSVSVVLLDAAAFFGGARTLLGNAYGLQAAPERRLAAMAARAAANQFGYFVGSAVAGAALAFGGYPGLGVVLGLFFVGAAAMLASPSVVRLRPPQPPIADARKTYARVPLKTSTTRSWAPSP